MTARFQVAMILWIKELPECLCQKEANFTLRSRGVLDRIYIFNLHLQTFKTLLADAMGCCAEWALTHPDYKQTFVGQNRGEHALITGIGLGSDITSALQINGGFVHSENSHGREWGAGLNLEYLW